MNKKLTISLFILLLCFIALLAFRLRPIGRRVGVLMDYQKLLSDPDAARRLAFVPDTKNWSYVWPKDAITVGYASFSFPFGDIEQITETSRRVTIDSDRAQVNLVLYLLEDFVFGRGRPGKQLPGFTYAGGSVQAQKEEYRRHDIAFVETISHLPGYEFHKAVHALKPKPLLSLLLADFDYLYLYEKLMETKNAELWDEDVFLFETEDLKGVVDRQQWDRAGNYIISIWNAEGTVYQVIQVAFQQPGAVTEQEIRQFITSFSYQSHVIESNSENLRPIILEALQQNAYYIPEADIEQQPLLISD